MIEWENKIEKALKTLVYDNNYTSILLCVSGGIDSVVMLDMLARFNFRHSVKLSLFHLNHNTRKGESDRDADFVGSLARQYELPLYLFSHVFASSSNFEAEARRVRYDYINALLDEHKIDCAATAHSADDSVETSLMRLFSGTSIFGLRGIDAQKGSIIRPLLGFSKEEIQNYAQNFGLEHIYDSSNSDIHFERNFMRKKIIPRIQERYALTSAILRIQKQAKAVNFMAEKYILSLCKKTVEEGQTCYSYANDALNNDELAMLLARILRNDLAVQFSEATIDEIMKKNASPKQNMTLFYGSSTVLHRRKTIERTELVLGSCDPSREVLWNAVRIEPSTGMQMYETSYFSLEYQLLEDFPAGYEDEDWLYVSCDGEASVTIRMKQPGDSITHNTMTKKLKKIFINMKMNAFQKSLTVVIDCQEEVAAVLFPDTLAPPLVADGYGAKDKTKKILAIRYTQK